MFSQLFKVMGLSKTWPQYTKEEVREHNSASSLWIVAGNSVYDVTNLLGKHVGGDAALLKRGGGAKDCTQDFLFHGRGARRDAEEYKIGELVPSHERRTPPARPQYTSSALPAGTVEPVAKGNNREAQPIPASSFTLPQTTVTLSPSLSTENLTSSSWHASGPSCSVCETTNASSNGISNSDSLLDSHRENSLHYSDRLYSASDELAV